MSQQNMEVVHQVFEHWKRGAWSWGSEFLDSFETFSIRVDQIIDTGEHVVVLARIQGRGRASGADVDAKVGGVFTLRDAKIVRYVLTDSGEAHEASSQARASRWGTPGPGNRMGCVRVAGGQQWGLSRDRRRAAVLARVAR